ncbi:MULTISPECIES: hypothetical protein [unclassified Pseudoxanthomonas]|uniref:hypothetical protein n=1 Tax=unclassified Pseudoxanthomonas TaxID=2645906 RepID=UPI00307776AE
MTAISAICQKLSKPSPFDLAHAMGYVIDNAGRRCDRPVGVPFVLTMTNRHPGPGVGFSLFSYGAGAASSPGLVIYAPAAGVTLTSHSAVEKRFFARAKNK